MCNSHPLGIILKKKNKVKPGDDIIAKELINLHIFHIITHLLTYESNKIYRFVIFR